MSTIEERIPQNRNFLARPNFRFFIKKLPNVNYFAQEANMPGISLNPVEQPTPFVRIPYAGDHIEFETLSITFLVDEDMANYLEIWNWITALGFPKSHSQYRELWARRQELGEGLKSDASLMLLTSKGNAMFDATFIDAFPVTLSGLNFTSTSNDHEFIQATVSFAYTYYEINSLLN
jgi:hypothetical protein